MDKKEFYVIDANELGRIIFDLIKSGGLPEVSMPKDEQHVNGSGDLVPYEYTEYNMPYHNQWSNDCYYKFDVTGNMPDESTLCLLKNGRIEYMTGEILNIVAGKGYIPTGIYMVQSSY